MNIEKSFEDRLQTVPKPWPHPDIIKDLAFKSSGYFIYAATVIRFVDDRDFLPTERLEALRVSAPYSDSPFAHLDGMYFQILSTVPVAVRPRLLVMLCTMTNFTAETIEIEELLQLGDIKLTCRRVGSLLQVTQPLLEVHHASFLDFLGDPTRSGKFHINFQHKKDLARSILKAFYRGPRRPSERCCDHPDRDRTFTIPPSEGDDFAFRGIEYVISTVPPSEGGDLAPLFLDLNLDFFWFDMRAIRIVENVICWLENVTPIPEDVSSVSIRKIGRTTTY
ncbi:hypothetical protein DFH06DRAFT_1328689 [Mycena polygramma]|nr:hypothetical protein DFH06DRAFT_1328689 [Mycena polygramma]